MGGEVSIEGSLDGENYHVLTDFSGASLVITALAPTGHLGVAVVQSRSFKFWQKSCASLMSTWLDWIRVSKTNCLFTFTPCTKKNGKQPQPGRLMPKAPGYFLQTKGNCWDKHQVRPQPQPIKSVFQPTQDSTVALSA